MTAENPLTKTNKLPSLSLFFPAYNEAGNIARTITEAQLIAEEISDLYEIIIVNDGSTDETESIVKSLQKNNPRIRLISHEQNSGYGVSLRTGISQCQYKYIFFSDSDLQFNLTELSHFLPFISEYDVVIGYRAQRNDPALRILNAKVWNLLIKLMFKLHIKDINCAFKLFKSEVLQPIRLDSRGAMISAEILIKLTRKKVKLKEVPVTHKPRHSGSPTGAKLSVIYLAVKELVSLKHQDTLEKQVNNSI